MKPGISQRGHIAPPSPIRKLEPFARAAEKRGVKIFSLNIGQPDIKTPAAFLRAARQEEGSILAYGPSAGLYPAREAFAAYYRDLNLAVSIEDTDVLITTGGSEAIFFALAAAGDPGSEVLTPEPFYPNYKGFAVMAGMQLKTLPTNIDSGFALPSPETFEAAITPNTRAIIVCNPSNPTGTVYPQSALVTLVEIAKRHGIYIIADEVYREFVYDGAKPSSILQIPGAEEVAIVIDSTSKRLSACGARVGCLVTKHPELMNAVSRFAQARLSAPVLGQKGALASLPEAAAFISESIVEYQKRRDVTLQELNAIPGVFAPVPKGAFYLMARLPVVSSDDFCRWLLSDFASQNQTVMLAPGSGFYSTAGRGEDEVRIAYVLEENSLKKALALLGEALQKYPGKK
jgi:aspartate aminotransferase